MLQKISLEKKIPFSSKNQHSVGKFLFFEGSPNAAEVHWGLVKALSEYIISKRHKGFKNWDWSIEDWARGDQISRSEWQERIAAVEQAFYESRAFKGSIS